MRASGAAGGRGLLQCSQFGLSSSIALDLRSFFDCDARATHLLGVILQLGQPVVHAQLRLLVVDVDPGPERKLRDHRGIDVGDAPTRMLGEEVAAAALAPLAIAPGGLGVGPDAIGAARDSERFGLPQREGVDRPCRPGAAGLAVAVAHGGGLPGYGKVHRAAEAAPLIALCVERMIGGAGFGCSCHDPILFGWRLRMLVSAARGPASWPRLRVY